jgi:outer membrane protein assembly factor BamA
MLKALFFVLSALALTVVPSWSEDPVYYPRIIEFRGVADYPQADLLAASQLKPGGEYTVPQMSAHGKLVMDTGLFSKISYTFDGVRLIYNLVPSPDLIGIKNVNLPLATGKELDDRLHARVPLYRGKVPGESGILDEVRAALEKMLAEKGITATVQAAAIAGTDAAKTPAMNFSIADPAVEVGAISINGQPASALDARFAKEIAKITGSAYDTAATPDQIAAAVARFYHGKGYVDARIDVKPADPVVSADAIHIPFAVVAEPGKPYTLTGIDLAPGLLLTQAEFDKIANIHPGDPADARHVQTGLAVLEQRYHIRGQVGAKIHAEPTLDRAQATVHYHVSVDPGPVYTMGKLSVANVGPELTEAMVKAWSLHPGDTFNESAVLRLLAIGDANPLLKQAFTSVELKYTLTLNDPEHTVDVVLRLERRTD